MQETTSTPGEKRPISISAPAEGLMRRPEVLRLVGCHGVTLWRLIRAGKFPKPVHITSRAVGWRRADVLRWLAELE